MTSMTHPEALSLIKTSKFAAPEYQAPGRLIAVLGLAPPLIREKNRQPVTR
jgi:hypothetical protein